MVQRSDDKGDKRSPGKTVEEGASRDPEAHAASVLRERIRQAGGAATARASDHAPPATELLVPTSSAPPPSAEHSGVRSRPPEPRSASITPPLFAPPALSGGSMPVPWPPVARKRDLQQTRTGLGAPPPAGGASMHDAELAGKPVDPLVATVRGAPPAPSGLGWSSNAGSQARAPEHDAQHPVFESGPAPRGGSLTPRGVAPPAPPPPDDWNLSTARTQPMPRVRNEAGENTDNDERRRAELATTRKTQGLLRAPDSSGSQVGRYSVHDVSAEYVDTGVPDAASDTYAIGSEDDGLDEAGMSSELDGTPVPGEADAGTRPRRSTPKQRVGHRRSTRPEIVHARERATKRTDPGIRARTLRGGGSGSPSPLSAAGPPPLPSVRTSPLPAAGASQPPAASPPPLPSASAPRAGAAASVRPGAGASPRAAASAFSSNLAEPPSGGGGASIVIDPSLRQPSTALAKPSQSSYVPLPRDREAYEAFLRSAAGEHGGPPRPRPVWAQQETALIPREALEPMYEDSPERASWPSSKARALLGVLLIAISGGVGWWILEGQTAPPPRAASPLPVAPSAAPEQATPGGRAITLIATEPSGAELLLDGAVIGNTPLEVTRPAQGEAMYLVRLKGFDHQMVRVTPATHDAMHITLQPVVAEPTPAPLRKP